MNTNKTKHKNRFRRIGLLLTALVMSAMLLAGCSKEPKIDGVVNIFDYVTVTYEGPNGEGKATVNIDYDNLEIEMVGGKDKVEALDMSALTKYINCVSSLSFDIDKSSGLSNGDEVKVSVTYDQSAADAADVTFDQQTSETYKVKGLK